MKGFIVLAVAGLMAITTPALANHKKGHHAKKDTVFHHIGGKKAIKAVVDDFVGRCAADTRINSFFAKTAASKKRLAKFKKNLVDQICQATGGPCKYRGKNMAVAHRGMGIKEEHFSALVENLVASLDKFQVKEDDKNAILAKLGPMKDQIVEGGRGTASEGK